MIQVLLAAIFFGFVHPGSKIVLNLGIDLISFCLLYVFIRLLALAPVVFKSRAYRVPRLKTWKWLALTGLAGAGLQFSEFFGISRGLPVPLVTFLVYSHPIWSLIFSRVINREPWRLVSLAQVLTGVLGMYCLVSGELIGLNISLTSLLPPLAAAILIALWISFSNMAKRDSASSLTISFYYDAFALAGLLALRTSHLTSAMPFIDIWSWLHSPGHALAIVGYALAAGLLPNLLFYRGVAATGARAAGLILLIEPLVATGVSHMIWNDHLSSLFALGAALILFAAVPLQSVILARAWCSRSLRLQRMGAAMALFTVLLLSATPASASDAPAIHGMLVFGQKSIYFSHLPMFHSPHDYQVILRVSMSQAAQKAFTDDQRSHPGVFYTFVPKPMILPDVVTQKKNMVGDLYRGHFERDGVAIQKSVAVGIQEVIYFHKFNPMAAHPLELTYLAFGDQNEAWLAHLITQKPDFDQIMRVELMQPAPSNSSALQLSYPDQSDEAPLAEGRSDIAHSDSGNVKIESPHSVYTEFEDLSM